MSAKIFVKINLMFALIFVGSTNIFAAENNANAATPRPKIALVLSGGGARGMAHIGVFKALEKMRVPYDCIVGTSMGAIAGGSFASGISVQDAERIVVGANWDDILSDTPRRTDAPYFRKSEDYQPYFNFTLTLKNFKPITPKNVVGVQNIGLFFREITNATTIENFDHLPVPYRAIGTDIVSGQPVVINSGTVAEAMRASMSIPGIFPPIHYQHHLLVDGGLSMNVPVSEGRKLCGDVIIAVNVATPSLKKDELQSFLNIGEQVINISMQSNMNEQMAQLTPRDILITPKLDGYSGASFNKAQKIIDSGEAATLNRAEQLKPYQLSEEDYAAWQNNKRSRTPAPPVIEKINIAPMQWVNAKVMSDLLNIKADSHFAMSDLHKNIKKVYARGDFTQINYELENKENGKADIAITPEEKPGRDFLRVGLGLYSDFNGRADFSAIASLRRAWLNALDGEWRTDIRVGRDSRVYSEWYQPASLGAEFFIAPHLMYEDHYTDVHFQQIAQVQYEYTQVGGGLELGSVFGRFGEVRAGVMRAKASVQSQTVLTLPNQHYAQGGYTLRSIYDQLDSTYFPHSGSSARLNYFYSTQSFGADLNYKKLEFSGVRAFSWSRNTVVLKGRAGSALNSTLPLYDAFSLGGIFNVSAYPVDYFRGSEVASASAILYQRISDLPSGLGQGIYGGAALEGGEMRDSHTIIGTTQTNTNALAFASNKAVSASVFLAADTVLGPFYLLAAVGDQQQAALYLALGISF